MIGGLMENVLWLSLLVLLGYTISGRDRLAGVGWVMFGFYWLTVPGYYLHLQDYFNVALTLVAAAFSFYLGIRILSRGASGALSWVSKAAAIGGVMYFPFVEIPALNSWLIGSTTKFTYQFMGAFGIPVIMDSWNVLILNGRAVEIVLACTAIESIALFAGVILSVDAPGRRRLVVVALSTMAIYTLNLGRNAFVLLAYGDQWFGEESFYLAHNVIAKIGSTIALLLIAYVVFSLLPELLDHIDELTKELRLSFRNSGRGDA